MTRSFWTLLPMGAVLLAWTALHAGTRSEAAAGVEMREQSSAKAVALRDFNASRAQERRLVAAKASQDLAVRATQAELAANAKVSADAGTARWAADRAGVLGRRLDAQVARAAGLAHIVRQAHRKVVQAEQAVRDAARREDAAPRQVASRLQRPAASGMLLAPVSGAVLQAFGAEAEDGPASGVTYGTARGDAVTSPCAGRVAFAAPFRSYGRLLILDCGSGTDVVLAGLGSIAARPGRALRAGERLGRMPDSRTAKLYVELRENGQPRDPAPFLKAKL